VPELVPMSPLWWVSRLHKRLVVQQEECEFFDAYYRGDSPLPWLTPQNRAEFRRIMQMTRSNYMGLVCDATAERLQIEGFRLGADAQGADADTWRIWQANNLDSDSDQGILESLICGLSYMLVAPNPADEKTPFMWVEHPSQAILAFEPGSNRRVRKAGLKVWDDDWTGEVHSSLWVDGFLHKFKAARREGQALSWEPRLSPMSSGQRATPSTSCRCSSCRTTRGCSLVACLSLPTSRTFRTGSTRRSLTGSSPRTMARTR